MMNEVFIQLLHSTVVQFFIFHDYLIFDFLETDEESH